jgi:SAM-dependent methyltransferase
MHISFLPCLVDPHTQEALELSIDHREGDFILTGMLASPSHRYPIVRGVPRFAGYTEKNNYTKSFGYQWNKWSRLQFESENVGKTMQGHTLSMWQRITAIDTDDLGGAIIADFGCGSGRFIEIVRMKHGRVIGIDLSDAVEAAGENFRRDCGVLICQADVLRPPIRRGSMDGAFSIGVLHHTPNPRKGFEEMSRTVKPGGWIAISVYGKGGYYDFPTVSFYRAFFKVLWPWFKHYPPLVYAYLTTYVIRPLSYIPVFGKMLRFIFPFVKLPDIYWSLLDTFDSVTPSYQSSHESYEIYHWFKECGMIEIAPSNWGFTAYHAFSPQSKNV